MKVENSEMVVARYAVIAVVLVAVGFCGIETSCAAHKGLASKIIQGNAEACVAYAKQIGDEELEKICQTADDLAPILDLIAARRRIAMGAAPSGSASASVAPPASFAPPPVAAPASAQPAASASAPAASAKPVSSAPAPATSAPAKPKTKGGK